MQEVQIFEEIGQAWLNEKFCPSHGTDPGLIGPLSFCGSCGVKLVYRQKNKDLVLGRLLDEHFRSDLPGSVDIPGCVREFLTEPTYAQPPPGKSHYQLSCNCTLLVFCSIPVFESD